jgi:hypothetical protein
MDTLNPAYREPNLDSIQESYHWVGLYADRCCAFANGDFIDLQTIFAGANVLVLTIMHICRDLQSLLTSFFAYVRETSRPHCFLVVVTSEAHLISLCGPSTNGSLWSASYHPIQ